MYKKCKTLQSAQRQQHIIETLISLMQTNTYDEISVSTLCEQADIPRKAFYRYFDSKEDLLQATLDSVLGAYHQFTAPRRRPNADMIEDFELFFLFWKEHKSVLQAIRFSQMSSFFVVTLVGGVFNERKGDPITSRFAITGLFGVLLDWAYRGFKESPESMAKQCEKLFSCPLMEALFQ